MTQTKNITLCMLFSFVTFHIPCKHGESTELICFLVIVDIPQREPQKRKTHQKKWKMPHGPNEPKQNSFKSLLLFPINEEEAHGRINAERIKFYRLIPHG